MIMLYAAIAVFLGMLIFIARIMLFSQVSSQFSEIAQKLRAEVLALQTGQLSTDEFNQKQQAIHESLANIPVSESRRHLYWSIPVCIFSGMLAIYSFFEQENLDPLLLEETASKIHVPNKPEVKNLQRSSAANAGGDLNTLATRLAKKMEKDPKNGEGWLLLARTYSELRKPSEAANAYEKAAGLLVPDPQLLADWIDARVITNGNQWDQKTKDILSQALLLDNKNLKTLSLAGTSAYAANDFAKAKQYWSKILTVADPQSKDFSLAELNIKELDSKLKPATTKK
ncbi:tetratricopeptide repeat protein [Undibacterium sp. Ji22W]|uniref:tetratricopeptide repeat protein n=1 Tax=Undibacterium sp. Ji22W TaxID=3413038 RepID=UPI003BEF6EC9